ncbi:MAG: hypothetical protein SFZ02_06240 [bacterium]|nr:hypothetical protein [bacterium]
MAKDDVIMWFDMVEGFEAKLQTAVDHINKGGYVPEYGDVAWNLSFMSTVCVREFARDMGKLTPEDIALLEEYYRVHRANKTRTTSIRLASSAVRMIDDIAKWLVENTSVRHVYHGDAPNRKLIVLFAIYHIYHLATHPQQP